MARTYTDKKGYKRFSDRGKLAHVWSAEKKVGGKIYGDRVVHHRDGDKSNFNPSNLQVMSRSDHSKLHAKKKKSSWY